MTATAPTVARHSQPPRDETASTRRRYTTWTLIAGVALLLGCTLVMSTSAEATAPPAPRLAQPADPCAGPGPYPVPCPPGPTTTAVPPNPCLTPQPGQPTPPGCLPRPTSTPSQPAPTPTNTPPARPAGSECGILNPSACVGEGIAGFLHLLVGESLNILLSWVGSTLLSTPTLADLPRVGELWEQSRLVVVAVYSLVVMLAGVVLMGHESVQVRYSIREIAPRLVVGFLAANLSLIVGDHAIRLANATSLAVLGDGLDPQTSGKAVTELFVSIVANSLVTGGLFAGALSVVLTVLLLALLVGYIVRVALTVILLAGAPLPLMCHGLPQTEGLAYWFWRAGAGVLGIQVGQSLTLICALKVFLEPGGFHFFGATADGLVNLVVLIALVWILVKIPGWVLRQVQIGGGRRSFVGGLAHAFVFGKAMGLPSGRGLRAAATARSGVPSSGARGAADREPPWPARIHEWGGVGGRFTPEAIGRRLHAQLAYEASRRRSTPGQQHLRFMQATPQVPTHDLASWNPAGSTTTPAFRSASDSPTDTSVPLPRPVGTAAAPTFSTAEEGTRAGSARPPQRRAAPVPPELQFKAATSAAPVRPVRATGRPEAPVFRPAAPDTGAHGRRARTHTPAPVLFQAPRPTGMSSTPLVRKVPPPRPTPSGGDKP